MKTIIHILASLMMLVMLSACYDKSSDSNNVAVLDLEVIVKATKQDEIFQAQIKQADSDLSNQIKELAANMEKKLAEIRDGIGDKPSEEQKAQYQQSMQQANLELKQAQTLAKNKLLQYEKTIVSKWREQIQPIAQSVAQDKGANIVVMSNPTLIWFSDSIDITDEVLGEVRKQSSDMQSIHKVESTESTIGTNP